MRDHGAERLTRGPRRATPAWNLALEILHRQPVPPAVFVKHQLLTQENVNHVYPNDELIRLPVSGPS
jgi:hypothetical protein